jgi:hypothetical protein
VPTSPTCRWGGAELGGAGRGLTQEPTQHCSMGAPGGVHMGAPDGGPPAAVAAQHPGRPRGMDTPHTGPLEVAHLDMRAPAATPRRSTRTTCA